MECAEDESIIIWSHSSDSILGMTQPFNCPHASVLGRPVPNSLPTGKKAEIRLSIGLTNRVLCRGTQKVKLEGAGETNAVDSLGLFIYSYNHLEPESSGHITHDLHKLQTKAIPQDLPLHEPQRT